MRTSSRSDILDAALRVVDASEGRDITYQAVAREAGLTKAGLMYHFPTKDSMMIAVIEHVIERWQVEMRKALGMSLDSSTLAQRVRAFIEFVSQGGTTRGEFAIFSEAVRRPDLSKPWATYLHTWFGFGDNVETTPLLVAWLAANGLWISESTGIISLTSTQRSDFAARLVALIEAPAS